jgi:hypothetical protein
MPATRTKFQRERDLEEISTLYLQGWSQMRIAEKLNSDRDYAITQQTISNDLKEVNRRWRENTVIPIDDHKQKELARIDLLEQTYWSAWDKSLETAKTTSTKVKDLPASGKDKPGSKQYEASTRNEERDGNPAFLAGVERCIKMRMDLLGLNAPVKSEDSMTIKWEIVREDDSTGNHATNSPAEPASGTEDYLQ